MNSKFVRLFLLMLLQVVGFSAGAQQIAVVTGNNTTVHQTLADAIESADNGSVIYLPGGGFNISDDVKITKRITIIGNGHKANSENADGATMIGGSLWFNSGSDGSALMGCYLSGNVNIAEDAPVNNVTIKLCNINSVQVLNSEVIGTYINQNYMRKELNFGQSQANISNNVLVTIRGVRGGVINNNNFITCGHTYALYECHDYSFYGNLVVNAYIPKYDVFKNCGNYDYYGNFAAGLENDITIENGEKYFPLYLFINVDYNTPNPIYNYHFKDEYKQYESQVGIYAGTGFSDGALPPVPYIVAKNIAEQTDAAGKLRIKLRVNAGE